MATTVQVQTEKAPLSELGKNLTISNRVVQNEQTELALADKHGVPDHYLSTHDTLWYHWQGNIYVKPIRFEAKTGTYVIALKCSIDSDLGKHRHRGPVTGYTVKGAWGYKEYVRILFFLFSSFSRSWLSKRADSQQVSVGGHGGRLYRRESRDDPHSVHEGQHGGSVHRRGLD
jgi:hypothetical protein